MRRILCLAALVSVLSPVWAQADSLDGLWKGTLRRRHVYQTRYHQAVYQETLDVTLLVRGQTVSGHASAVFSDPFITRTHLDPAYAQWRAVYPRELVGFTVEGQRMDEGKWLALRWIPLQSIPIHYAWKDGTGARTEEALSTLQIADQALPWTDQTMAHFVRHRHVTPEEGVWLPVDLRQSGERFLGAEYLCEGGFTKVETPPLTVPKPIMLGCLILYLLIVVPGVVRHPGAPAVLALVGTLVGTLDALEGLGLWEWARMARLAGFGMAALLFFLEMSRLRQQRMEQESPPARYGRILFSMGIACLAFFAGLMGMSEWMQVCLTAGVTLGRHPATALAVSGAIAWTYGLSKASRVLLHKK